MCLSSAASAPQPSAPSMPTVWREETSGRVRSESKPVHMAPLPQLCQGHIMRLGMWLGAGEMFRVDRRPYKQCILYSSLLSLLLGMSGWRVRRADISFGLCRYFCEVAYWGLL